MVAFRLWWYSEPPGLTAARERDRVRMGSQRSVSGSFVCSPTTEALDAVYRWSGVSEDQFFREIGKTGSVVIGKGDRVTVVDPGIIRTQIRLESGEDCWVMAEAVR
jgi:hypothetical protein